MALTMSTKLVVTTTTTTTRCRSLIPAPRRCRAAARAARRPPMPPLSSPYSLRHSLAASASRSGGDGGSENNDENDENKNENEDEKEVDDDLDRPPSDPTAAGALSLPLAGADTDWREFRARLVGATAATAAADEASTSTSSGSDSLAQALRSRASASSSSRSSPASPSSPSSKLWAHPLSRPERGCVLVAHPLLFTSTQTYFSKSVVFLIEHDGGEGDGGTAEASSRGGTCGLILNKPTTITLSDVGGGVAPLLPAFGDSTLYLGGDVERSSLHVIHGVPDLEGSLEVVSGVRVGGVDAAAAAVREGRASASDFKFLHGYCGWAPGQLEREFRSGVWFAAAASSEVLLRGAALAAAAGEDLSSSSAPASSSPPLPSATPGQGGAAAEEKRRAPPLLRSAGGDSMWHAVLELMGGEHAEMSRALRSAAAQRPPPPPQAPPGSGGSGEEERR